MQAQPTNINAFYAELEIAKSRLQAVQGEVEHLENQIRDRGGVVPGEEKKSKKKDNPKLAPEANETPEQPVVEKPLDKLNREQLNAKAVEAGVEKPEELENKNAVIKAITAKEGQK